LCLIPKTFNAQVMQGDLGRKINIMRRDSMGHCEKREVHMNMCLIMNGN